MNFTLMSLSGKILSMNQTLTKHGKSTAKILAGGLLGFALWTLFSHPRSAVNKKWPEKRIKRLQILPNIKYHSNYKTYHLHHWIDFAALYIPVLAIRKGILRSKFLHGFFLGSIIQGLVYKDRFHIVKKLEELAEEES